MKKKNAALLAALILVLLAPSGQVFAGGNRSPNARKKAAVPIKGTIVLSTTTSTQDSGLLEYLLPVFTAETGWKVDTIAVGTGAALQMGRDGEADVLLVHSRADEIKYVAEGYGLKRFDVMYNDYIIAGPAGPIEYNADVQKTFKTIADRGLPFVSRGDDSGTHKKELSIWQSIGVEIKNLGAYISAGQGMGATLQMAGEMGAYTLSDRATWLTRKNSPLRIVCEKSGDLLNYYGVIPVNPALNSRINAEGGEAFAGWLLKDSTQRLIGQFGLAEYGAPLFTPNAGANR